MQPKQIKFIFMLKRFENLGVALNRNESKKVVGGNYTVLMVDLGHLDDGASCTSDCSAGNGKSITCSGDGTCVATNRGCQVIGSPQQDCVGI